MADQINPWDAATDGPEGTKYLPLPGEGTDGDNAFLIRWADGRVGRAYCDPVKGIEALIDEVLHPPVLPPSALEVRKAAFKALPERADLVARLKTATPAEIDTWLTNNVTNLAQARTVLGAILKYLATMNGD